MFDLPIVLKNPCENELVRATDGGKSGYVGRLLLERFHASLKQACIRPKCPASLDAARTQVHSYVDHHKHVRLHSAIDYLTPDDKLNGLGPLILDERDHKLEAARAKRQQNRAAAQAVA